MDCIQQVLQAGSLLRAKGALNGVNIIQFVWPTAWTGGGLGYGEWFSGYVDADDATKDAGHALGDALHTALGKDYSQPIHFIGHSLGTVVSTLAVETFILDGLTNDPPIQLTALDRPDDEGGVGQEYGRCWNERNLPQYDNFVGDNYYTESGISFGDIANGGHFYNHPKLVGPDDVGQTIFDAEVEAEAEQHSGVQQWYRWTMNPLSEKDGESVRAGADFEDPTLLGVIDDDTLNPCQKGWYWSIINGHEPPFPNVDFCTTPLASTVPQGTSSATGCGVWPYLLCNANSTPPIAAAVTADGTQLPPTTYSTTEIIIPKDADYLVFDYRFTNADGGPAYAAVFLDDVLLWQMQGDTVRQGVTYETSTLSLRGNGGTRNLSVALFPAGDPDAAVEFSNFRFLTVPARCSFGVETLELASLTVDTSTIYQACQEVTASYGQITGVSTEVTLEAGEGVVLGSGFSVEKGASLRIVVGSPSD